MAWGIKLRILAMKVRSQASQEEPTSQSLSLVPELEATRSNSTVATLEGTLVRRRAPSPR